MDTLKPKVEILQVDILQNGQYIGSELAEIDKYTGLRIDPNTFAPIPPEKEISSSKEETNIKYPGGFLVNLYNPIYFSNKKNKISGFCSNRTDADIKFIYDDKTEFAKSVKQKLLNFFIGNDKLSILTNSINENLMLRKMTAYYMAVYNEFPSVNWICLENLPLNLEYNEKFRKILEENNFSIEDKNFDYLETYYNIKKKYGDRAYFYTSSKEATMCFINNGICAAFIPFYSNVPNCSFILYTQDNQEEVAEIIKCFSALERENIPKIGFVTVCNSGYDTTWLKVKKQDIVIDEQYNSDLPDDKIVRELEDDNPSLFLFHGKPGTGKTTYIKNLVHRIRDREFLLMDKNTLHNISDKSLMNLFINSKNAVIVLEDCEDVIAKSNRRSSAIDTVLNMTDGIIGDALCIKFICTFNCDIGEIDPAITRKGRMNLKYEFKELCLEKTKKLMKKLYPKIDEEEITKPMLLSDIFNYEIDNGTKNVEKKVGF